MIALGAPAVEVWLCAGDPARLDAVERVDAIRCAVAPDELHVVCAPAASEAVVRTLRRTLEDSGRTLRVTGAWHARLFTGEGSLEVVSSLIAHELPVHRPCFVQGRAGGVATRAVVADDAALVLVASVASQWFDARLPGLPRRASDADGALQRLVERCSAEIVR